MAETATHERGVLLVMPFTVLYAVFDRKSSKTRLHRIPALPKRSELETGRRSRRPCWIWDLGKQTTPPPTARP